MRRFKSPREEYEVVAHAKNQFEIEMNNIKSSPDSQLGIFLISKWFNS